MKNLGELTSVEMEDVLASLNIPLHGVFLQSTFPSKLPTKGQCIINLDPRPQGTHWTCAVWNKDGCVYFDSFGCPPPLSVQQSFLKSFRKYGFNNFNVQDINAPSCGWWDLAFVYATTKGGLTPNEFVNMFGDDTKKNEKILLKYVRSFMPYDHA